MRPKTTARAGRIGAGLGIALILASTARAPAEDPASPPVQVIQHNSRAFRLPFNIPDAEREKIKEIRLCVSEDRGETWTPMSRTTPDSKALAYRAPKDGEFWFTVQTIDTEGRLYPPQSSPIEPRMKVIVDTIPPELALVAAGRRGEMATVRWEVRDERLDRSSFTLEFQAPGARDWRQVPIKRPVPLVGERTWDAGTAEPIRVRATVLDRAKNKAEREINLPDGMPAGSAVAEGAAADGAEPPPRGSFASGDADALPRFPGRPAADPQAQADPPPGYNPFESRSGAVEPGQRPQLIRNPRFSLNYQVEDAGPGGPARVELWVTPDNGRTWSLRGTDPDRRSPFPVDLGGEGTFGLTLVAKSASDLGDPAPGPGDRPQYLVEVDSTAPTVRLDRVQPLGGASAGKIAIVWHASDLHLGADPVTISVRPDASSKWVPIGPPVENSGRFDWSVPPSAPPRFLVRIDVADTAGNVGSDETPENAPVIVDRTRPKSRIIGLEPSAMNASGPGAFPLR